MPRFFLPDLIPEQQLVSLPESVVRHIQVLRLRLGDTIELFDGRGGEVVAEITRLEKRQVWVTTQQRQAISRESSLTIHLLQAISSAERMDFTLQKGIELGIASFTPIHSERAARLQGEREQKKHAHWEGVAIAACEQCGRNTVPIIHPPRHLHELTVNGSAQHVLLSPLGQHALRDIVQPPREIVLLVGPEGGFSSAEEQQCLAMGWQALRLGPRILRTETAALATIAAMQACWGDF